MSLIALIPARSGSQRVPGKNIRDLAGHPLIAYTIQVAKDSGLFGGQIYVVSDSDECEIIAHQYGVQFLQETPIKGGHDSWWITQSLVYLANMDIPPTEYFILRPTSPFRTVDMLKRANTEFNACVLDVLKAIEPVSQHPKKMWNKLANNYSFPYIKGGYHYEPSNTFEQLYVQNASLEIRKAGVPMPLDGPIIPFVTEGYEGFDINTEDDWILAEALIERGLVTLPEIK